MVRLFVFLLIFAGLGILVSCGLGQDQDGNNRTAEVSTPDPEQQTQSITSTTGTVNGSAGTTPAGVKQEDALQELMLAVADINERLSKLEKDLGAGQRFLTPTGIPYTRMRGSLENTVAEVKDIGDEMEDVGRCLGEVTDYLRDLERFLKYDVGFAPTFYSFRCTGF